MGVIRFIAYALPAIFDMILKLISVNYNYLVKIVIINDNLKVNKEFIIDYKFFKLEI